MVYNGNPINGATNGSFEPIIDGNYAVEVYNSSTGCTIVSNEFIFGDFPTLALIDTLGDSLVTTQPLDSTYVYQWYLNDTAISGANNTSYTYTESGNYYVEVILPNGDTLQSNTITIIYETLPPTSIFNEENTVSSIYPNPAIESITVNIINNNYVNKPYKIISATGKTVSQGILSNSITTIDVSKLSAGVYFLKIEADVPAYNKFIKK